MIRRIEILECGHCFHPERVVLQTGRFQNRRFPSNVVLLEHATEGLILFDTGYSHRFNEVTQRFPEKFYALATPVVIEKKNTALVQLEARGISPKDIRHVILSHFHADHVGGVMDFPSATYHYDGPGYALYHSMSRFKQIRKGFLQAFFPSDFASRGRPFDVTQFKKGAYGLDGFSEGLDLFQDGSLILVSLPGHSRGHIGLFVQPSKKYFFVADATWTQESIVQDVPPSFLARVVTDHWPVYRQTLGRLHLLSKKDPTLQLMPCHCDTPL